MKIAFYKSKKGKILDKFISIFTLSKYSHCEMVFSDGISASSSPRDGGVRFKNIAFDEKWDLYEMTVHFDEYEIRKWFLKHDDNEYDFLGAFGALFGVDLTNRNKKFCSYSCATVLGIKNNIISPGKLFKILKNENII